MLVNRPLDPRRPFSRADARAAGITVKELLGPDFHKVLYDTYVARSVTIDTRIRALAALRHAPEGARISHHTAAELWGGAVPTEPRVHLTVSTTGGRLVRRGVVSHCSDRRPPRSVKGGVPLSTPIEVFLELAAAGLSLVDLVVLADSLIARERVTLGELREAAAAHVGKGRRLAGRAADLAREGVDSPMETRLRLLLVFAGFPEPTVNLILRFGEGEWQRRFDLAYERIRVLIEYEGRHHRDVVEQWLSDINRREELDRLQWRLVIVTAEGIYDEPWWTLERVRDVLVERGMPGVPRRFDPEWRLHFPGRR